MIEVVFVAASVIAIGNDRVTVEDPGPPLETLALCVERVEKMTKALVESGADDVTPQCVARKAG